MKITIEVDDDSAFTMDEFIRAFNEINEFSLKDRLAPRGHSFISKDKICGTEWLVDLRAGTCYSREDGDKDFDWVDENELPRNPFTDTWTSPWFGTDDKGEERMIY